MQSDCPVSEEDLHAYVDGGLDLARRVHIALYLACRPSEAARTEAFRAQKEGVRALFEHVLDQPMPDNLRHVLSRHRRRKRLRRYMWAIAGASLVVTVVLGGHAFTDRLVFIRGAAHMTPGTLEHRPTEGGYPLIHPSLPPMKRTHTADI